MIFLSALSATKTAGLVRFVVAASRLVLQRAITAVPLRLTRGGISPLVIHSAGLVVVLPAAKAASVIVTFHLGIVSPARRFDGMLALVGAAAIGALIAHVAHVHWDNLHRDWDHHFDRRGDDHSAK